MTLQIDEVTIVTDRLVDTGIDLTLVDFARTAELVITGARCSEECLGTEAGEFTRFNLGENAREIFTAERHNAKAAKFARRNAREIVDGTTSCRSSR